MPTKYQCKECSRSFVHKETLKEHKLLHGLVILGDNKFSCPICQCEVTCQSGLHQHGKNYPRTRARAVECQQASFNEAVLENGVNAYRNSKTEGIKLRLKNKNSKWKEMPDTDITDASGTVSCKICNRSFVYQKCLQKHTALVHGLSSEDRPKSEMKPDSFGIENVILPHQAKDHADHEQSVINENCNPVSVSQNVINTASCDGANSLLDSTKESLSEIPAKRIVDDIVKSAQLKVSPSDLKCKTCLKQFKHKAMLLRHMHMIHGETDFERCTCPLCLRKFSSQWTFSNHFDTEHKTKADEILAGGQVHSLTLTSADGDVDIARCDKCALWFTCRRSLQKHYGLKHRSDMKSARIDALNHKSTDSAGTTDTYQEIGSHEDRKLYIDTTTYGNSNQLATECQSGSSSNNTVQDVLDDHPQSSPKYLCSICNKAFVTVNFLDRHIRIKHSSSSGQSPNSGRQLECKTHKQTFVCGDCSAEFNKEDTLAEHMETCHKGVSAECACPICGCRCPNQILFSVHYDAAHVVNSALNTTSTTAILPESVNNLVCKCKVCGLWFTNEEIHHCSKQTPTIQPPKTGRARYRCMQCGEAFEILRRFLHHRKVKHRVLGPDKTHPQPTSMPSTLVSSDTAVDAVNGLDAVNGKDATASQCTRGRPMKSEDEQIKQDDDNQQQNDSLQSEEEVQKVNSRSSSSEVVGLHCPECRRVFTTVSQLRRHRKSEHRNRTCQLCGETCKSADMVYYHNLKHHHEQKCEVCGASCCGRLGLIDHFRAQHPTEPPPLINRKTLICEYCPRVFAGCASRLLRDHIESCHLGRVHLCDVCGKRLGSAQTLAVHRRMHDPVARFECHECNRRFPHNTNLVNHIRKHHPERLPAKYVRDFRCEVCSLQFGSSSGLSRHRSEKHGTQRFQCDMCLRVFPSVTGLRVHKRRDHHPKETSSASTVTPTVAGAEAVLTPPPPPLVAQFTADPTNAIMGMAGFMANMISLPGLGQTFQ